MHLSKLVLLDQSTHHGMADPSFHKGLRKYSKCERKQKEQKPCEKSAAAYHREALKLFHYKILHCPSCPFIVGTVDLINNEWAS